MTSRVLRIHPEITSKLLGLDGHGVTVWLETPNSGLLYVSTHGALVSKAYSCDTTAWWKQMSATARLLTFSLGPSQS